MTRKHARARDARPEDYPHFVRFFAALEIPDPTPDPAKWESELVKDAFFVLDEDAAPTGYGLVRAMDGIGHVAHVVVDEAARGRGLGRAVMGEAARRLRAAGCVEWYLNVKPGNVPAIRLYEGVGLRKSHASVAMEIAWADVPKVPLEEPALAGGELDLFGVEDRAVERVFDLPHGLVASLRARKYVLIGLFEGGDVAAFAGFDPAFPGASPFRVKRASLARGLLEAMRPHVRPEHTMVRFVVESDPVLVTAMQGAGAVVKVEILQMRGKVPADT